MEQLPLLSENGGDKQLKTSKEKRLRSVLEKFLQAHQGPLRKGESLHITERELSGLFGIIAKEDLQLKGSKDHTEEELKRLHITPTELREYLSSQGIKVPFREDDIFRYGHTPRKVMRPVQSLPSQHHKKATPPPVSFKNLAANDRGDMDE